MRIESYDVSTSAQRSYTKVEQQRLSATVWGANGQVQNLAEEKAPGEAATLSLSDWAKEQLAQLKENTTPKPSASVASTGEGASVSAPASKEELKLRMLDEFLFSLTGKRINSRVMDMFKGNNGQRAGLGGGAMGLRLMNGGAVAVGGRIEATSFKFESESVSYNAQGVIKTADGKTINVDVSMHMSREFMEYTNTTLEFGAAQRPVNCVDPLVINYAGTAASLTGEKFEFDLDADGVMDKISFAGAGSGFLALDKNGDGTINNGSELFGPNTGNGFEELRTYDKDGNSWIDENDEIFNKLRIWSKDQNGNDRLFTLQELGIGAIYLGDVATEFSFKDAGQSTQGIMRSTSFFLKEHGGAGTISHIDLTV